MAGMRKVMRMLVTGTTVLGLVLLALALSGISSLAGELETVTPKRSVPAPASEQVIVESRRADCPLGERTPDRRPL